MINRFHDHHNADVAELFDRDSLAIADFEKSVKYDVALLRNSPTVPNHIKIYRFFYEIDSGTLLELARDVPGDRRAGQGRS